MLPDVWLPASLSGGVGERDEDWLWPWMRTRRWLAFTLWLRPWPRLRVPACGVTPLLDRGGPGAYRGV